MSALERLADELRAEGGLLAAELGRPPAPRVRDGDRAASGTGDEPAVGVGVGGGDAAGLGAGAGAGGEREAGSGAWAGAGGELAAGSGAGAGGEASTPGRAAAAGPRTAAGREEYELLIEAIYEGYRQHYAEPRLMGGADPDLALLAGDRLYAIGLERLVALGDVAAVVELADVISLCALAHARGEGELAEPVWAAGARAVGWGASPAYQEAKALLLGGDQRGPEALRAALGSAVRPPGQPGR